MENNITIRLDKTLVTGVIIGAIGYMLAKHAGRFFNPPMESEPPFEPCQPTYQPKIGAKNN